MESLLDLIWTDDTLNMQRGMIVECIMQIDCGGGTPPKDPPKTDHDGGGNDGTVKPKD